MFVTLESGKECVAVIEFDSFIESKYIIKDGVGEDYHTTVTIFSPDVERNGEAFDYAEYLSENTNNEELNIIEESPKTETAVGETLATVSEKELSNSIISYSRKKSTGNGKKDNKHLSLLVYHKCSHLST